MRYTRIGAIADDRRNSIVGESRSDKNAEEQRGEKGKLHVSMHKPLLKDTTKLVLQSALFGNVRSITDATSLQVGSWGTKRTCRSPHRMSASLIGRLGS